MPNDRSAGEDGAEAARPPGGADGAAPGGSIGSPGPETQPQLPGRRVRRPVGIKLPRGLPPYQDERLRDACQTLHPRLMAELSCALLDPKLDCPGRAGREAFEALERAAWACSAAAQRAGITDSAPNLVAGYGWRLL